MVLQANTILIFLISIVFNDFFYIYAYYSCVAFMICIGYSFLKLRRAGVAFKLGIA